MGAGAFQSQAQSWRLGGEGVGQQAQQLLQQLQQQVQAYQQQLSQGLHVDGNYNSILGPSLDGLKQALTGGPSSLVSAFNDFTADFHVQLGNAGILSLPFCQKRQANVGYWLCTLLIIAHLSGMNPMSQVKVLTSLDLSFMTSEARKELNLR